VLDIPAVPVAVPVAAASDETVLPIAHISEYILYSSLCI
jgi:hypothetical protein